MCSEGQMYRFIHTKRAMAKYAQRSIKGKATRKGMDEGQGGQTLSLQEREGENRKQSANLGRNEKEKKKRGPGRFRARRSREGSGGREARRRMTVALAMAWPRRTELCRKQWWRY